MESQDILAVNIRKYIEKRGYPSIEKFCLENGIPTSTIYDLLKNPVNVKMYTLRRVATALEIPDYQLLKP